MMSFCVFVIPLPLLITSFREMHYRSALRGQFQGGAVWTAASCRSKGQHHGMRAQAAAVIVR